MPRSVIRLGAGTKVERSQVGGKGAALAALLDQGLLIPRTLLITTEAYRRFVQAGQLEGIITMEVHRKDFRDMRWEELWDASLRVRNRFLATPFPPDLELELGAAIRERFGDAFLAVRSSSVAEDSASTSFAGLHDSYVNIPGNPVDAVLDSIKLVWSSLWSDRALLYRQELNLNVTSSAMAVVVQELVQGEASGVMFTQSPDGRDHIMIEAVYGLNQGLVDGSVEPDRWTLSRSALDSPEHRAPEERVECISRGPGSPVIQPVGPERAGFPPLVTAQVTELATLGMEMEQASGVPQDVEWTFRGTDLFLLQARPVTTGAHTADERSWYLSLRKSLDSLRKLRERVEDVIIPQMDEEAARHIGTDLSDLPDPELKREISERKKRLTHWEQVYRDECIPLAHGARLFGELYNDTVRPKDPFEFVRLLAGTPMESLARNQALQSIANLPADEDRADQYERKKAFLSRYGAAMFAGLSENLWEATLERLLESYRARGGALKTVVEASVDTLGENFFHAYKGGADAARELLDLGRASYRLRDDDNIYLGKIRSLVLDAEAEWVRRHGEDAPPATGYADSPNDSSRSLFAQQPDTGSRVAKSRQIVGQPASQGLGDGIARVILSFSDLKEFRQGEILVCDSIDPTMTWVCPLAAGIVERRGGMLIHGAIIAREYGVPCVTGVTAATERIRTGNRVTVDGFLGIVVIHRNPA